MPAMRIPKLTGADALAAGMAVMPGPRLRMPGAPPPAPKLIDLIIAQLTGIAKPAALDAVKAPFKAAKEAHEFAKELERRKRGE